MQSEFEFAPDVRGTYIVQQTDGTEATQSFFQEYNGVKSVELIMELFGGELCYDLHCLLLERFTGQIATNG